MNNYVEAKHKDRWDTFRSFIDEWGIRGLFIIAGLLVALWGLVAEDLKIPIDKSIDFPLNKILNPITVSLGLLISILGWIIPITLKTKKDYEKLLSAHFKDHEKASILSLPAIIFQKEDGEDLLKKIKEMEKHLYEAIKFTIQNEEIARSIITNLINPIQMTFFGEEYVKFFHHPIIQESIKKMLEGIHAEIKHSHVRGLPIENYQSKRRFSDYVDFIVKSFGGAKEFRGVSLMPFELWNDEAYGLSAILHEQKKMKERFNDNNKDAALDRIFILPEHLINKVEWSKIEEKHKKLNLNVALKVVKYDLYRSDRCLDFVMFSFEGDIEFVITSNRFNDIIVKNDIKDVQEFIAIYNAAQDYLEGRLIYDPDGVSGYKDLWNYYVRTL